jgi:hypothetical protein
MFPGIQRRALIKSVELRLSQVAIDVEPDGQSAVATATLNFNYQWNRPRIAPTGTGALRWNLRKINSRWAVVP